LAAGSGLDSSSVGNDGLLAAVSEDPGFAAGADAYGSPRRSLGGGIVVPVIAHIVGGGSAWPLWLTGALLFGGAVGALFVRRPTLHRPCMTSAIVGLVTTIAVYVLLPGPPGAPRGLSLSIAAPRDGATVTSPVVVRACAGADRVPGAGRLLSISVDGRQVAELQSGTAAIDISTGEHSLRVELVTSAHQAFAPPMLTDETVNVSGVGPLSPPPECPAAPVATP
jgi:hypothetical protein